MLLQDFNVSVKDQHLGAGYVLPHLNTSETSTTSTSMIHDIDLRQAVQSGIALKAHPSKCHPSALSSAY